MTGIEVQQVDISSLKPHPKNYKSHPEDQIEHICASIKAHGFYRNIVISNDGFILAGHGVVEAAKRLGMASVPVRELNIAHDDPRAMQVIIGDNEIAKLSMVDDRALTEMLKDLSDFDASSLLGTGFDNQQLAALVFNTRTADEIEKKVIGEEWIGMPEYLTGISRIKVMVFFNTMDDRRQFEEKLGISLTDALSQTIWFPKKEKRDMSSVEFKEVSE